ncbi:MAG TPA: hypothetical protein VK178_12460 [Opitutaceae bacterium]|nr:hypothetical protein [Opitutaceae bacterium]
MSAAHALRPRPFSDAVLDRLARLSPRAERSRSLFAAPLGPDEHGLYLPRFVAFGPNSTDSDARVSLLAGFAEQDDRASLAAFDLLERAVESPTSIGGVVLDVVPVVNRGAGDLWSAPWVGSRRPELALLEREYRRLAPHAIVQLRSGAPRVAQGAIRGDSLGHWLHNTAPSLFAAIWREEPRENFVAEGIDELVPDLPFRPLEIHLTLGPDPDGNAAALRAIVQRIRELLAHAQHL